MPFVFLPYGRKQGESCLPDVTPTMLAAMTPTGFPGPLSAVEQVTWTTEAGPVAVWHDRHATGIGGASDGLFLFHL